MGSLWLQSGRKGQESGTDSTLLSVNREFTRTELSSYQGCSNDLEGFGIGHRYLKFPVPAQDGIAELGQAHARSAPPLGGLPQRCP